MAEAVGLSARNEAIKQLRRLLRDRGARWDASRFVIEGPTLVADALASHVQVCEVFVDSDHALRAEAANVLTRAESLGVKVRPVAPGVLQRVGSTSSPQPLMAVAQMLHLTIEEGIEALGTEPGPVLVLGGVSDPGNAGTLVRSAAAGGGRMVLFADGSVDPYNPKVVRASAGALFRTALVVASLRSAIDQLVAAGFEVFAASATRGTPHHAHDLAGRVAIVLGNEARGLPETARNLPLITVPIDAEVDSLNVAMAGTVICFEAKRQRETTR